MERFLFLIYTIYSFINISKAEKYFKINKINIGHDGKGSGASWKVEYVWIIVERDIYRFNANRWIDGNRLDLTPSSIITRDNRGNLIHSFWINPLIIKHVFLLLADYEVSAVTANKLGAGTDANVFVILYGDKGKSEKMQLKESKTNSNPFEKGK